MTGGLHPHRGHSAVEFFEAARGLLITWIIPPGKYSFCTLLERNNKHQLPALQMEKPMVAH
jgi:hypothetical protein